MKSQQNFNALKKIHENIIFLKIKNALFKILMESGTRAFTFFCAETFLFG